MPKKWITHLSFPSLPPPLYADYRELMTTFKLSPWHMLPFLVRAAHAYAHLAPSAAQDLADKVRQ